MKIVYRRKALLDLAIAQPSVRHQCTELPIDVGPRDAESTRALGYKHRARADAAVQRSNCDGRALPVALEVLRRVGADPDLVDQAVNDRVSDFGGGRVRPREFSVGGSRC